MRQVKLACGTKDQGIISQPKDMEVVLSILISTAKCSLPPQEFHHLKKIVTQRAICFLLGRRVEI